MLDAGDRSVALEASSHGSALRRLDRVRFDVLVFTNLSQDHLDLHGSMEEYFQAKRRLFTGPQPPPAAVNVGTSGVRGWRRELAAAHRAPLSPSGSRRAPRSGRWVSSSPPRAAVSAPAGIDIETPLRGRFNVENVLGVVAAGHPARRRRRRDRGGRRGLTGVPGRFEAIDAGQPFTVIVDYAHTPDSLDTVLQAARELGDGRLIVVFGAGGDRDRGKRPLMGRVARDRADLAIVTSDNPRSEDPLAIIQDVLQGAGVDVEIDPDRRSAIAPRSRWPGPETSSSSRARGTSRAKRSPASCTHSTTARSCASFSARRQSDDPGRLGRDRGARPGRLERGEDDGVITGILADSRLVGRGDLFVALNSGVGYVATRAQREGRRRSSRRPACGARVARVARALEERRAGRRRRRIDREDDDERHPRRAVRAAVPTVSAERSLNNEIGLPLTVCRLEPETRGARHRDGDARPRPGRGALRRRASRRSSSCRTIGPEHLELLGTVERVAEANAEAIAALPSGGAAVVPAAGPELEPFLKREDIVIRRFSIRRRRRRRRRDALCGRTARSSSSSSRSRSATSRATRSRRSMPTTRSACHSTGAREGVAHGSRSRPGAARRSRFPGGGFVVNDAYNANPTSMRAALVHLAERAGERRRVAILGEMAELGEQVGRYHRRDRRARRGARYRRDRRGRVGPLVPAPRPGCELGAGRRRGRAGLPRDRATPSS